MPDKLMHIPNDETQDYYFCRLQIVVEIFGHSTSKFEYKSSQVVKPTN